MPTKKNESTTRKAKVYATDVAIGDILVDIEGNYLGTVDSEPGIDYAEGRVAFELFEGERTVRRVYRSTALVRIEIARRVR